MQPYWSIQNEAEQHRQELLKEAAQEYDLAQVRPVTARQHWPIRRIYAPLLAALGRLMLAWGTRLSTDYSG